jgi:hypothetical protein
MRWNGCASRAGVDVVFEPRVTAVLITVFVAIASVAGCRTGRMSETLSRPTALELIRSVPQLWSGEKLVYEESTHQEFFNDRVRFQRHQVMLSLNFRRALVRAGVLTGEKQQSVAGNPHGFFPDPGGILLTYSVVPQRDVAVGNSGAVAEFVQLTLAEPEISEIQGIQQDGTTATAIALLRMKPTDIYGRVSKCAQEVLNKECKEPDSDFGIMSPGASSPCNRWPSQEQVNKSEQRNFQFARFDDGWRIVTP